MCEMWINSKMVEKMPSGISAAMTAISASNHKKYLTNIGYSALHNSDRCFPERLTNQKKKKIMYVGLKKKIRIFLVSTYPC